MKKNKPFRELFYRSLKKKLLAMRFAIILLFLGIMQVHASDAYSQRTRLSLDFSDAELIKVLDAIEDESEFFFLYNEKLLDTDRKVNITVKDQLIDVILDNLFAGTDVKFTIIDRKIILAPDYLTNETELQQRSVSGTVTDENGNPMPGVNIQIEGTITGVTTDINGKYSIEKPNEDVVLIYSFIGYITQKVSASGKAIIDIRLNPEVQALDEVVVVGYGTKQLYQISSSVSVVSGEKLNNSVVSNNVSSLLQGQVAGLVASNLTGDPNASTTLVIRGSSSITAGSDPLTVVDGIIGGSASPNDIESITVLKDAAATGLFGSRAANGVIIITTKSGKQGKTKFNALTRVGLNNVTTGNFKMMDSQQLYDFQKMFFAPADFARDRPPSLLSQNTNWFDMAYRTGVTQEYELSASGGDEKNQFYLSGNYYNEQGTLKHTGFESYNLRANYTHKVNQKLELTLRFNAGLRLSENEASGKFGNSGATSGALLNLPWDNPFNPDGTIRKGTEADWIGREKDNFLHGWQYNYDNSRSQSLQSDFNLDYKILPNLTFSTYDRFRTSNSIGSLYYDQRTKPGKGIGSLNNSNSWSQSFITSNRLHYNNNFGKHYVNALAVAEAERNYSESNGAYGEGFVAGISVMDAAAKVLSGSGSKNETAFTKVLAQLDYNYDNRYFAIGSIINEASSLFGSNNRSANFFTLGGSWILSNENFMKNLTLFDLLKIRASYGSVGNANISNYQSLVLYALTTQYNNNPGSFPKQMGNPDLTWEKVKTADFAIEVGVLKRISLIVDMYSKKSSALLLNVQVPFTSGFEYSLKNIGAVRNKGLELTLSTFNLIGEFKWNTDFNIAFNRNKVLKLDDLGNDIILSRSQIVDGIISVGYDMNTWYLRKWLGVDPQTGDPLWEKVTTDENGNEVRTSTNVYSEATMQKIGGMSPKFTGGITNTFSYKRISLSVFFNFVQGNQILHRSRQTYDSDGFYDRTNAMVLADGWSRWQKPGDVATHPKPVMGGNKNAALLSTRYLENGSFIRMRNVSISYVLPTTFLQNLRISNARIFVSGDNLWTLTKFSGLDPEVIIGPIQGGGTTNYSSDMDYPISKKILFGLNVEF